MAICEYIYNIQTWSRIPGLYLQDRPSESYVRIGLGWGFPVERSSPRYKPNRSQEQRPAFWNEAFFVVWLCCSRLRTTGWNSDRWASRRKVLQFRGQESDGNQLKHLRKINAWKLNWRCYGFWVEFWYAQGVLLPYSVRVVLIAMKVHGCRREDTCSTKSDVDPFYNVDWQEAQCKGTDWWCHLHLSSIQFISENVCTASHGFQFFPWSEVKLSLPPLLRLLCCRWSVQRQWAHCFSPAPPPHPIPTRSAVHRRMLGKKGYW